MLKGLNLSRLRAPDFPDDRDPIQSCDPQCVTLFLEPTIRLKKFDCEWIYASGSVPLAENVKPNEPSIIFDFAEQPRQATNQAELDAHWPTVTEGLLKLDSYWNVLTIDAFLGRKEIKILFPAWLGSPANFRRGAAPPLSSLTAGSVPRSPPPSDDVVTPPMK
jgi:hypothetical protein